MKTKLKIISLILLSLIDLFSYPSMLISSSISINKTSPLFQDAKQQAEKVKKDIEQKMSIVIDKDFEKQIHDMLKKAKEQPNYQKGVEEATKLAIMLNTYNSTNSTSTRNIKEDNKDKTNIIKEKYILATSSSLPKETLRNYAWDSIKLRKKGIQIIFTMRGFVNGMSKIRPTLNWYISWALEKPEEGLSSKNKFIVPIEINPLPLRTIKTTPALYDLASKCIVYGDAPLKSLIEAIKEKRCNQYIGRTFAFQEEDALKEIQRHFLSKEYKKRIKKQIEERLRYKLTHFKCINLPFAKRNRKYTVTPMYELTFNIPDPRTPGKILYPKGFKFNPLQYANFIGSFVLINADRKEEIINFNKIVKDIPKPIRVLITEGNYINFSQRYGNQYSIYAHCPSIKTLVEDYKLCRGGTPCIITVEGTHFIVKEIDLTTFPSQKF